MQYNRFCDVPISNLQAGIRDNMSRHLNLEVLKVIAPLSHHYEYHVLRFLEITFGINSVKITGGADHAARQSGRWSPQNVNVRFLRKK